MIWKDEKEMKELNRTNMFLVVVMILIMVLLGCVYIIESSKPVIGGKRVTIEVVNKEKESIFYEVYTDAEFLRQVMQEVDELTFDGVESSYGMLVYTINGETADYNVDGSYWSFYVNNQYCNYGIDSQPVYNEDEFRIEYTVK